MRLSADLLLSLAIWSSPSAVAQNFAIVTYPTSGGAYGITAGPDGALWFTEPYSNQIGRISTGGVMTHFPAPTPKSFIQGITAGPDGALWFTEYVARKIGRITTGGTITEFSITIPEADPLDIATGSDGSLWFTQNCLYTVVGCNVADIGRITTDGAITEYNASAALLPWPCGSPSSMGT
jgi:virginiamycin B lyase